MTAFAEQLLKWQGNAQSPAALRLVRLLASVYGTASSIVSPSCFSALSIRNDIPLSAVTPVLRGMSALDVVAQLSVPHVGELRVWAIRLPLPL